MPRSRSWLECHDVTGASDVTPTWLVTELFREPHRPLIVDFQGVGTVNQLEFYHANRQGALFSQITICLGTRYNRRWSWAPDIHVQWALQMFQPPRKWTLIKPEPLRSDKNWSSGQGLPPPPRGHLGLSGKIWNGQAGMGAAGADCWRLGSRNRARWPTMGRPVSLGALSPSQQKLKQKLKYSYLAPNVNRVVLRNPGAENESRRPECFSKT